MRYETIHETPVKDIVDLLKDGIDGLDSLKSSSKNITTAGSLTKATAGLTLVFPVLVDKSLPVETATMVSKAIERKAVSLLQIAFSAFNITDSKDATEWISKFHTNLKGRLSLDDFLDAMDSYVGESAKLLPAQNRMVYEYAMQDLKNLSVVFEEDVNDTSISDYTISGTGITARVIKEAEGVEMPNADDYLKGAYSKDEMDQYDKDMDRYNKDFERWLKSANLSRAEREEAENQKKAATQAHRNMIQNAKDETDMIKSQLLPTDVKKANEMVPTMMVVNFVTLQDGVDIVRQMVIGVKAKMYEVTSQDVINKIITLHSDSNTLLKFIKASTREISFVKDFLLAIDDAKLTAVSNSKKGSNTNKLLKVLERRALGGKIRKTLRTNNAYKAISTLVISREVANAIEKQSSIKINDLKAIRKIMEKLNLMIFCIADDSSESLKILLDTGDDIYETLSYTQLERESNDAASKKAINLMAKVAR